MLSPRSLMLLLCAAALAGPAAAQKLYKYTDADGKVVYTDKMPASAAGKPNEQLNKQGTVTKRNEGALTPEQVAAQEAERKRKLDEDMAAKEEKRKNMALLNTYSSEQDIAEARARALKANADAVEETQRKVADAKKRQQELAAEAEFYKKKPMPGQLKQDIQVNDAAIVSHTELLDKKKKETDAINTKYDEDLRRYRALVKSGLASPAAPAPRPRRSLPRRRRPRRRTHLVPASAGIRTTGGPSRPVSFSAARSPAPGWPCPCVAFITWPTSELNAFSLPAR